MTTRIEMLRRLNDIMTQRIEIAKELAPFYAAAKVLAKPGLSYFGETDAPTTPEINYETLENHPNFRPLWLEDQELKNEWTKLLLNLA